MDVILHLLQRVEELERRMAQMIVDGKIAQVDHVGQKVKVVYGQGLTTGWIKWNGIRAGKAKIWWPPEVGEAVTIVSPGDLSHGRIVASHYQTDFPAASDDPYLCQINFDDVSTIQYQRVSKELTVTLPDGAITKIITPGGAEIVGDTKVTGNLDVTGTTHSTGSISSDADVSDKTSTMQKMRDKYNEHDHSKAVSPPAKRMD